MSPWVFQAQLSKEYRAVGTWETRVGMPFASASMVSELIGAQMDGSRTAFIFGSGRSLLDLQEHNFAEIRNSYSVGFGAFALHNFVPTAYALSPVGDLIDYGEIYTRVLERQDIIQKQPALLILRPRNSNDVAFLRKLPKVHHRNAFLYGRVSVVGNNASRVGKSFEILRASGQKAGVHSPLISLDSGATVLRLVSILALAGAREIVLLGIDILNSKYFWDEDASYLRQNGFTRFRSESKESDIHATQTTIGRQIPILSSLPRLSQHLERFYGIRVSLGTQGSALANFLHGYTWKFQQSSCG